MKIKEVYKPLYTEPIVDKVEEARLVELEEELEEKLEQHRQFLEYQNVIRGDSQEVYESLRTQLDILRQHIDSVESLIKSIIDRVQPEPVSMKDINKLRDDIWRTKRYLRYDLPTIEEQYRIQDIIVQGHAMEVIKYIMSKKQMTFDELYSVVARYGVTETALKNMLLSPVYKTKHTQTVLEVLDACDFIDDYYMSLDIKSEDL